MRWTEWRTDAKAFLGCVCALHKAKAKCERRRRGGKEGQMKGMNGWGKGSKETLLIQQHGRATQQQRVQKGDGGMEEADDERLDKLSSSQFWAINDESQNKTTTTRTQ
ncbi:hypothetical protein niasHT_021311 [Heterodera trifolii]|uniref:Uncharacterized protein n=1 Tax=Heterodera trifolii TaxID=157864 RepID=A0ABD2K386_9BILA